jgi:hypothetical protein
MNYRWWSGSNATGGIAETRDPVDHERVFGTFAGARKALADHLGQEAMMWAEGYRNAKGLRLSDMAGGEVAL